MSRSNMPALPKCSCDSGVNRTNQADKEGRKKKRKRSCQAAGETAVFFYQLCYTGYVIHYNRGGRTMSSDQLLERMNRIGSKKNFMAESQAQELQETDRIITMSTTINKGIQNVELVLEPTKLDELSSTTRLTFDEYCEVINLFINEEEDEWDELRMKDQINLTRDAILEATMLKYAKEVYQIDKKNYAGMDLNYYKRYDQEGRFLGEATVITLTSMPMMGVNIHR